MRISSKVQRSGPQQESLRLYNMMNLGINVDKKEKRKEKSYEKEPHVEHV